MTEGLRHHHHDPEVRAAWAVAPPRRPMVDFDAVRFAAGDPSYLNDRGFYEEDEATEST